VLEHVRIGVKNLIATRCVHYRIELPGGFFPDRPRRRWFMIPAR
jgi:hypothetical protein